MLGNAFRDRSPSSRMARSTGVSSSRKKPIEHPHARQSQEIIGAVNDRREPTSDRRHWVSWLGSVRDRKLVRRRRSVMKARA
jgi:hypothetical protein